MDINNRNPADTLTISVVRTGRASVVTVSGGIDAYTAPRLHAELGQILAEHPTGPLFLDLTAATFIGSAGLAVLVETDTEARHRHRVFGLVVDHSVSAVIQPLQITGLTGLFATYSDVAQAITQSQ